MDRVKKTGIMGGTFNPIHQGHLLIAEYARDFCALDEILFVPSGNYYMKDAGDILDKQERLAMTALAIANNPFFSLSTIETERKGATYTHETLQLLKEMNPRTDYYFIVGADNLFSIEKWKNPQYILKNCVLIAAARGQKTETELLQKKEELEKSFHARIILLPEKKIDISSSEIRQRLSCGKSVRYMLPESVLEYISLHQLYQPK